MLENHTKICSAPERNRRGNNEKYHVLIMLLRIDCSGRHTRAFNWLSVFKFNTHRHFEVDTDTESTYRLVNDSPSPARGIYPSHNTLWNFLISASYGCPRTGSVGLLGYVPGAAAR
jgi:hypothetical protein